MKTLALAVLLAVAAAPARALTQVQGWQIQNQTITGVHTSSSSGVTYHFRSLQVDTTSQFFGAALFNSSVTASSFWGDGSHLTNIPGVSSTTFAASTTTIFAQLAALAISTTALSGSTVSAQVQLTGLAVSSTALSGSTVSLRGIVDALGLSSAAVSASTVSLFGSKASTGTDSGLVKALNLTTISSPLTISNSSMTVDTFLMVKGSTFSVGGSTFNVFGSSVGIRMLTPMYALDVGGDIYAHNMSIVGGTETVVGNAFSVGGTTFSVLGGVVNASTMTFGVGANVSTITSSGVLMLFSTLGSTPPVVNGALRISSANGNFQLQIGQSGAWVTFSTNVAAASGGSGAVVTATNTWSAAQINTSTISVGELTTYNSTATPNKGYYVNGWTLVASSHPTLSNGINFTGLQVGREYRLEGDFDTSSTGQLTYTFPGNAGTIEADLHCFIPNSATLQITTTGGGTAAAGIPIDKNAHNQTVPYHIESFIRQREAASRTNVNTYTSYYTSGMEKCFSAAVILGGAGNQTQILSLQSGASVVTGYFYLWMRGTPFE